MQCALPVAIAALLLPLTCPGQTTLEDRPWAPGEKEAYQQVQQLKATRNVKEAIPAAESWVKVAESHHGPGHPLTRPALEGLAMLYLMEKRFPEAEPLFHRVLAMAERDAGPFHSDTERILRRMIFLYEATGQSAVVRDLQSRQQVAASRDLSSVEAGRALLAQGERYRRMGRFAEAERVLKSALETVEKELGPNHAKTAVCHYRLSQIYGIMARPPAESEQAALRSLEIAERTHGARHPFTLNLLTVLTNHYNSNLRRDESATVNERKLNLWEANFREHEENLAALEIILGPTHDRYQAELNSMLFPGFVIGRGSEATRAVVDSSLLQTLERILPLVEEELGPDHRLVDDLLRHTGSILLRQDRFAEAEPIYLRRIEILEKRDSPNLRTHLSATFRLYQEWNQPEKARVICQRLLDYDRQYLKSRIQTRTETVLQSTYMRTNSYAALTMGDGPLSADAILLYKGIADSETLERRKALLSANRAVDDPRVARFQALRHQLIASQLEGIVKGNNFERIGGIEKELQSLEDSLIKDGSLASPSLSSLNIQHSDVAAALPPNMAVIDYFYYSRYIGNGRAAHNYGCSIIRKDRPAVFVPCGSSTGINNAIFDYRDIIAQVPSGEADDAALEAASKKLYGLLFANLMPHLDGIDVLVIAPDKTMHLLPFPTLQNAQGRFLAESFLIYHVSSGRDLLPKGLAAGKPGPAVVVADPQFATKDESGIPGGAVAMHRAFASVDLQPLPGTRTEGRSVYRLIKQPSDAEENVMALVGAQATERALRNVKSPRILHLATHGFFLSDLAAPSNRSSAGGSARHRRELSFGGALALSGADDTLRQWSRGEIPDPATDGILFTGEIPSLDLDGTELVVLSACRTALGSTSGEGVNGMRRAFVTAGARNVLMTLWDIADEPTAEFMTHFYQRFQKSGNAPFALAEVQRQSLVSLREKAGLSVAVYLAGPFVLSAQAKEGTRP